MGLLDMILSNMMGAGGSMQGHPGATSLVVTALMMLLAAEADQHYGPRLQGSSMGGILSGLLGGGGGLAEGCLVAVLNQFRQIGYGDHVSSRIGTRQRWRIPPAKLSQELPVAVDYFAPDDRLPTEQEALSRRV